MHTLFSILLLHNQGILFIILYVIICDFTYLNTFSYLRIITFIHQNLFHHSKYLERVKANITDGLRDLASCSVLWDLTTFPITPFFHENNASLKTWWNSVCMISAVGNRSSINYSLFLPAEDIF